MKSLHVRIVHVIFQLQVNPSIQEKAAQLNKKRRHLGQGKDEESSCTYCPCDISTSGGCLNTREGCAVELELEALGSR